MLKFLSILLLSTLLGLSACDSSTAEFLSGPPTNRDFTVGRAPGGYPVGTDDVTIVSDTREHLEGLVEQGVTEEVFVLIYFNDWIPLVDFDQLVKTYDLRGGYQAAMMLYVSEDGSMGLPLEGEIPSSATVQAYLDERVSRESPSMLERWDRLDNPAFTSITLWATPADALRMWNEDSRVRLIGVGGRKGNPLGIWRPVAPGESFR